MKIVCTGGRGYENVETIMKILNFLNPDAVFVGDCPTGADKHVRGWMRTRERIIEKNVFTAQWQSHGFRAGPIRNGEMLDAAGRDALVIAFPGGKGTADCIRKAQARGMMVLEVKA